MHKLTMQTSIEINAPVEKVWQAITDPEIIKQYFFGTNLETSWKPGEPIYFRGEWEGKSYEDKGTILQIEPQKRLQFNYWSNFSGLADTPENYSTVTYELSDQGDKTVVLVKQDNIASDEAKNHSESNWQTVLQGMKKLLEEK